MKDFLTKAKDAGYLLSRIGSIEKINEPESELMKRIDDINEEVRTYNAICPAQMQRRKIE